MKPSMKPSMKSSVTALRLSPVHDLLQSLAGTWRDINDMPVLVTVPTVNEHLSVAIADLSYLRRFGVKGSGAIDWLAQQGLPIPPQPNSWGALPNRGIIARLGMTEFLIEEEFDPPVTRVIGSPPFEGGFRGITAGELESQSPPELGDLGGNGFDPPLSPLKKGEMIESPSFEGGFRGIEDLEVNSFDPPLPPLLRGELESQDLPPQVYPVLRQDLAIALYGTSVQELLLQTCSFNFRALSLSDRPVILTSMVGVAVTVIPGDRDGVPFYRIWCDGTFGAYFWETLLAIAQELGGGAIGIDQIQKMKNEK